MDEWYRARIWNVLQWSKNEIQSDALKSMINDVEDYVTRCAVKLLIVDETDLAYLLERLPLRLPFFLSRERIESFNKLNTEYAFKIFGVHEDGTFSSPHHAEYFLAKFLTTLNCKHMAPTEGVRSFL